MINHHKPFPKCFESSCIERSSSSRKKAGLSHHCSACTTTWKLCTRSSERSCRQLSCTCRHYVNCKEGKGNSMNLKVRTLRAHGLTRGHNMNNNRRYYCCRTSLHRETPALLKKALLLQCQRIKETHRFRAACQ